MKYVPDPYYNPDFQSEITSRTKLAPGISMAKFLGGYGDAVTLNFIPTDEERKRIARQLLLQADAMLTVTRENLQFSDYRLIVAEGLYNPEPTEVLDVDGINYLMKNGQAVVYELLNKDGTIDPEKTFDLAVFWKDNINFDKLILDYDTYDPNGTLNVQVILVMPKIISPWTVQYSNTIETRFNNFVQSTNELVECKLQVQENIQAYT
jgi:hypothetical protein